MNGWHCALWIDHEKARFAFFDRANSVSVDLSAKAHEHGNIHHKAGVAGSGKSGLDRDFIEKIEQQLRQCREFVVVGPGTAKLEFIRHIHRYVPALDEKLAGVETMELATDAQLVEFA